MSFLTPIYTGLPRAYLIYSSYFSHLFLLSVVATKLQDTINAFDTPAITVVAKQQVVGYNAHTQEKNLKQSRKKKLSIFTLVNFTHQKVQFFITVTQPKAYYSC